jgi:hypothetical protein
VKYAVWFPQPEHGAAGASGQPDRQQEPVKARVGAKVDGVLYCDTAFFIVTHVVESHFTLHEQLRC